MSAHIIDRNSGEAVYIQISRSLEHDIKCYYKAGDFLPSEHVLAKRFSVNRHTLRRGIDELVNMGVVERCHGRGTMVLEPPLDYTIAQNTRFTECLESQGKTTDSKVIRKLVAPAQQGVSRRLNIPEGEPVIWIETLRRVNRVPFCVISHFLPQKGYEAIENDYSKGSLHQFLQDRLHINVKRTESYITAVLPMGDDAQRLNMPQNAPVLRVKSLNVNVSNDQPVEYAVTRFRADRIQLGVTL